MDPNTTDYSTAYNQLGSVYDPQTHQVQSQIDQLAPQQQAQQASLDQAKVNAFKDITNSANSKGVLFSGVPIDQRATYVGTKYLPAVADLNTSFNNTKNTLLGQINTIQAARVKDAQNTVTGNQAAQSKADYQNAQLALSYARLNNSQGNTANSDLAKQQALYKVTGKSVNQISPTGTGTVKNTSTNNGYNFTGPNGTPVSLAQYVAGSGGGVDTVLNLLQNGSKYDQNIYKQVYNLNDPNAILSKIQKLDTAKAYGF